MILFRNDFIYLSHYFFLYRKSFISSSSDLYTLLCLFVCPSEYSIWQRGRWGPIVLRITCYFDINKCIFDTILFIDLKCFSSSNAAHVFVCSLFLKTFPITIVLVYASLYFILLILFPLVPRGNASLCPILFCIHSCIHGGLWWLNLCVCVWRCCRPRYSTGLYRICRLDSTGA